MGMTEQIATTAVIHQLAACQTRPGYYTSVAGSLANWFSVASKCQNGVGRDMLLAHDFAVTLVV